MEAGLALALASAAALNWGYFVQHGAAAALPWLTLRRPLRSLRLLFADLRWFGGFSMGIGGWVLYVAALLAPEAELSTLQRVERRALLSLKGRFQLDNLLAFNRKFFPTWQPRFVVYERRRDLPRVGVAALTAEAYLPFSRRSRR